MRLSLALCLVLLCAVSGFGQTPAPLTNQDIIELHKAGISAEVIVAKIKASPTKFDTSVSALQELKKAGIPDPVMLAVLNAVTGSSTSGTAAPDTPVSPAVKPAASLKFPPRGTYKHKKEIETEYDRFKDVTHVRLKYLNIATGLTDRISIVVAYSFKGTTPIVPETISLGFFSYSKEWRFLKNRSFAVIADGERLDFGEAARIDGSVNGGRYGGGITVSEALLVEMPLESFLKIVNAANLQVRLGYYELLLAPDHYEALKDFASRINVGEQ